MLTKQLREREKDGLIQRVVYPEVLPRVEYSLTALGRSLRPIINAPRTWGDNYVQRQSERRTAA